MAIQIKLKNSVVQDSTPSTSDLPVVGELALNANINSIGGFMRASDNSIVKIFGPGSVTTPTATTTVSGISELATNSETTTGTATNRVVTPAGLNAVTVAERTTSNNNYVAKAGSTMTGVLQLTAGSSSAPAIHFGDSDSGIYAASGGNNVRIAVGGSDAISASTGGGINFSLAVKALTSLTLGSQSATDKPLFFADANSVESASLILDNSSNEFRVRNNRFSGKIVFAPSQNVEKARIDNAGRLLIGTSSSQTVASSADCSLQVVGSNFSNSGFTQQRFVASALGPALLFAKSRSNTIGTQTIVQDDDELGKIRFYGSDGNDFDNYGAEIKANVDGTPGSNDMPGRLTFSTTADGAASPTENLVISSTGQVGIGIGSSTPKNNNKLHIRMSDSSIANTSNQSTLLVENNANTWITVGSGTSSYGGILFGDSGASDIGQIRYNHNGNNLEFHTNSSERMRILSDGKVGIGTSSPAVNLDISAGSGTAQIYVRNTATSGEAALGVQGKNSSGTTRTMLFKYDNNDSFRFATAQAVPITFATSDAERMRITSGGSVGIGTVSPSAKFEVVDGTTSISFNKTSSTPRIDFKGNSVAELCQIKAAESVGGGVLQFFTKTTGGTPTERMRIDTSGRVGIGTTNIDTPLTIARSDTGSVIRGLSTGNNTRAQLDLTGKDSSGNAVTMRVGGDGDFGGMLFTFTNHKLGFATNNASPQMVLDTSGRLLINVNSSYANADADNLQVGNHNSSTPSGITLGSTSNSSIRFSDAGNATDGWVLYNHSDTSLRFGANNAERMRIDSGGDVGIGTTNPTSRLSVVDDSGITIEATTNDTPGKLSIIGKNNSGQVSAITRIESVPESSSNAATTTRISNRDNNNNVNEHMRITSSGRVRLPGVPGVAGSNLVNVSIESDGNLCTTTSIRAAKKNIATITDTSWLFNLNPVTFNWRTKTQDENGNIIWGEDTDGGTQYGLIAEEVKEVKNDFCYYDNDGNLTGVHYDRLVAPLLKAIQDLKTENTALATRVAALEAA